MRLVAHNDREGAKRWRKSRSEPVRTSSRQIEHIGNPEYLIENRLSIDLIAIERGRYFRIVATVLVDGVDLAQILIAAGVGVPYNGKGPRHSWCE